MAIILGIDPALNHFGWAVIDFQKNPERMKYLASGVFNMPKNVTELVEKIQSITSYLQEEVLEKYKIESCAMEESFVNVNPATSLKLGIARGAMMSVVLARKIKINEYTPRLVKKTVSGSGKADKQQISTMVKFLMPEINKELHDDESDAIAVAATHAIIGNSPLNC